MTEVGQARHEAATHTGEGNATARALRIRLILLAFLMLFVELALIEVRPAP